MKITKQLQQQFAIMCATGMLFKSEITGQQVWDLYLKGYGKDPVYRDPNSSTHNCNYCNNFIRRYGNIVTVIDNEIVTIWDLIEDEEFDSTYITSSLKSANIQDVFFEHLEMLQRMQYDPNIWKMKVHDKFRLGVAQNHKLYTEQDNQKGYVQMEVGSVVTFNHLHVDLPKQFVLDGNKSVEAVQGDYRTKKEVFQRLLNEVPKDTLILVRDLINQESLLNGKTHLQNVNEILKWYDKKRDEDWWYWIVTYKMFDALAKFKNTLIGTLCTELAEGMDLNKACENWNKRVDPVNYMKAKAPITKAQIALAEKFVVENGYETAFDRRLATLTDIDISEIKHVNNDTSAPVTIFSNIKTPSGTGRHKRSEFDSVSEVQIEDFMNNILPNCTSVEVLLENNMVGNFVNLTTSKHENAKQIFQWSNPFSWTFNGNLAGKSQITEAVKKQGGKTGVLRFSIMWSEGNSKDDSDLDAHCEESKGDHIYFSSTRSRFTKGELDIDITAPLRHKKSGNEVVENITYPELRFIKDGVYRFYVHQYASRNSQGFKAEISMNGELFQYEYNRPVRGYVNVAEVTMKNGVMTIDHKLPHTDVTRNVWGLDTQEFHKVNLICKSPNHWGDNGVGNLHYLFMLEGCKNPDEVRSFHNEQLISDLREHRKVLDVLGMNCLVPSTDNQLAGVGFNATVRSSMIVRCKGSFQRVIKINF